MEKPIRGSGLFPDHIMLSISDDAKTTMTVTWRTDISVTDGYVLYKKDGENEYKKCTATDGEFISDIDKSRMHWAKLTALEPGTKYFYTCGDDTNRSAEFFFKTEAAKDEGFKFICVSDQQCGTPFEKPDYSNFNRFIKKVLEKNPDTAFILTGGDNTDCGQHEQQWNGAFSGFEGISEYIPVQMSVGNHDNRGFKDYKNGIGRYYAEPAEFFDNQFKGTYAYDGPENWKTENYTFNYGNAHFCIIGINGPEDVNDWLLDDLSKNTAEWKFGSYHFPICYSGVDCQNYDAYPVMRPSMEMLDILFSGHEHNFSRSFPMKNENLFERPSKGTIHYMLGNSDRNPPGSKTMRKVWHAAYFAQEEHLSCVVIAEVKGKTVKMTSILEDGRIVDECLIDKENDVILPHAQPPFFGKGRTKMMFKGMDLGLLQNKLPCIQKDGIWYAPLCILFNFIGGDVEKLPSQIRLSVYGHTALFTENSDIAKTDRGDVKLPAKVIRADRQQLYIPLDGVEIFEMRWAYADRNNFISVEHESESSPLSEQP